jgi:oxygen-dependent protoporphyrinogen oxidase
MSPARRVVIVGGGVTGLTTAYALLSGARKRGVNVDVTLVERGSRLGGSIVTEKRDGFTIDGGPDSWVAAKPFATALAKDLGLGESLVPTVEATRRVYVAHGDALHVLPEGLVLAVPTRIAPVVTTRLFSWGAKLRMGAEPFVPKNTSGDDESIADFVTRRLGREVSDRLAAPMLGGIFAGDATKLSMKATFPQMVEMERTYGSLVRGMRAQRRAAAANGGGKAPSAFLSLEGGVGSLVDALVAALAHARVRTNAQARAVSKLPEGDERGRYAVDLEAGDTLFADDVVLTAPTYGVASVVRPLDPSIADELDAIPYASTATVFLAFRRQDVRHPLDAAGFIVPRALGRPLLASTWVSSKWEGRAPNGHVLIRAFFGGAWGESTLARDDEALVALARSELAALMALDATPLFSRVFRFDRASAQPIVGHLARVARIREQLTKYPGLRIAGAGFGGIGIPECVRQGNEVAAAILGELAVSSASPASASA